MPDRCVAANCSKFQQDGVSLHSFPFHDQRVLAQWTRFVNVKRAHWSGPSRSSKLCSAHFTSDCFDWVYKAVMGLGKRKQLKKGAVPTIQADTPAATPARTTLTQTQGKKRAQSLGQGQGSTGQTDAGGTDSTPAKTVRKSRPGRAIQKLTINRVSY